MKLLIKKAQRGDADAFVLLMEQNKQAMYKIAKAYLKNEEDIADVLQDSILSAFEHINQLKKTEFFKTWLIRIVINNCNNILKAKKKCTSVADFPDIPYEDQNRKNIDFMELIDYLDEKYRYIFLLYYGEGFNTREVAELLEINENTVKSRLQRGRERLHIVLTN